MEFPLLLSCDHNFNFGTNLRLPLVPRASPWVLGPIMSLRKLATAVLSMTVVLILLLLIFHREILTDVSPAIESGFIYENTEASSVVRNSTASVPAASEEHRTYVLALRLAGQQGSGVRSLSVFQCFLSSVHKEIYVVEPSVKESYLMAATDEELKFSSLFDFDYFNRISKSLGYPKLVEADRFQEYASNDVIYVHIGPVRNYYGRHNLVWDKKVAKTDIQCLDNNQIVRLAQPYQGILSKAKYMLSRLEPKACIVRIVELWVCMVGKCSGDITERVSDIRELIFGDWLPYNVTLVFTHWYNKFFVPVRAPLNGIDCMRYYAQNVTHTLKPSDRLVRDADIYRRKFLGNSCKLAIMLRFERVMKYYLSEDGMDSNSAGKRSLNKCLKEVTSVVQRDGIGQPFVTLDIGKFGTRTIHNKDTARKLVTASHDAMKYLYDKKWSVEDWEKSFIQATGGVTNIGYIAALQRIIASRADCLVLMGGGSFQSLAVGDYMQYHEKEPGWKPCIHLVCVMTTRNTQVQKAINSYNSKAAAS